MNVLVDSGGYALNNVGDIAMLQVAVSRLQALWPEASIGVLSASPDRLARYCPGAKAVASNGLRKWLEWSRLPGRSRAPKAFSRHLAATESGLRDHLPGLSDGLAMRRAREHPADRADLESFLSVARSADLLVLGGGGYMTDVFRGHALSSLELLSRFQRRRVPTAMVGQGIGPLSDRTLVSRSRVALPRTGMIGLREGRAGLPLLASLGVARSRIQITGDDAIEPAFASRPERLGTCLGINVRVSSYSSVGLDLLARLRSALGQVSDEVGATLRALPVARAAADSDVQTLRELLGDTGQGDDLDGLDAPLALIRRVGECRVVVTGSYHAGVFALSQGIPVVGLTRSTYYTDKFLGLADQFGTGCNVVGLDQPDLVEALSASVRELWRAADGLRPLLLAAAASQIQAGHDAYARLSLLAGQPGVALPQQPSRTENFG